MKYKVGDKVKVKSLDWYNENKNEDGYVDIYGGFTDDMSNLCGKEVIIETIYKYSYRIKNNLRCWTDEMFEDDSPEQTLFHDNVNNPSHYTSGGIECIDAMIAAYGAKAVMDFCKCNAFKYQWRFDKKNGDEDIKKAQWYQNKYLELEKEEKEKVKCTE